jgi:hypothetical protein
VGTGDDANLIPDLFSRSGTFFYIPYRKNLRLTRPWILLPGRGWFLAVKILQELAERSQILAAVRAALGIIRHGSPATFAFHHEVPSERLEQKNENNFLSQRPQCTQRNEYRIQSSGF